MPPAYSVLGWPCSGQHSQMLLCESGGRLEIVGRNLGGELPRPIGGVSGQDLSSVRGRCWYRFLEV